MTPWGKMRALDELRRGAGALSTGAEPGAAASRAAAAWACTGCMHCRELCLLDNPVADTLRDGRADALANGLAPPAARALSAGWSVRMKGLQRRALEIPGIPVGTGSVAYLPGCTAVVFEADTVAETARGVAALTEGCSVLAGACCGAPLLDAGDREGFVAHAKHFAASVASHRSVVTADAGCAYALRVLYPRHGIPLPPVEHVAELAGRNLGALRRVHDPRAVIYHDSCKLGRGLGVYGPPRAVLAALRGSAPAELPAHGPRAPCSGAGGLLPVTMPETAAAIARELAGEAREVSPDAVVVTACAASRRQIRAAGVTAEDLAVWIARGVTATRDGL